MSKFQTYTAVFIILRREGKVYLQRRAGTGYRDGWYGMPAGHVEEGESLLEAALRELREETGLIAAPENMTMVHAIYRRNPDRTYNDWFYTCEGYSGEPQNTEPEKCDDARWFALGDLPQNLVPEVARALQALQTGQKFSELDVRKDAYHDAAH